MEDRKAGGYARAEVRRMLGVTERQLRAWERLGFVKHAEVFTFTDLLALKTLARLRQLKIPPSKIQSALTALRRRLKDIDQPLAQLRMTAEGRRIAVHVSGEKMEAVSGQLLFDFDAREIEKLRSFPVEPKAPAVDADMVAKERESEFWFQKGLQLEETGAPVGDAIAAYRKAIALHPQAAGALVNLGTISFRAKRLKEAEDYYSRAIAADPDYPLAQFNLGNLCDEQGRAEEARSYYLNAIRLNPRYADAYFNLALLCERQNEILKAIGYWQTYLKLDSTSTWARAARKQLEKLKSSVRHK